ncbi:MAG: hypothetical protein AAGC93_19045 [Cyanobacteria bacterium P01_F01_bin.53]
MVLAILRMSKMRLRLFIGLLYLFLGFQLVASQKAAVAAGENEQVQPSIVRIEETQLQNINDNLLQISKELSNLSPESKWYDSSIVGVIVGAILGAGLSAIGSLISGYQSRRKSRINLSYQIMKEWDDLREERNSAYEIFVIPYSSSPMPPFSSHTPLDRVHMNKILEFFDRLDLLHQQKLIDDTIVIGYLSQDYQAWENDYISKQRGGIETDPTFTYAFNKPCQWLL